MYACCLFVFFFSSRRRHTRWPRDWSSDVCSSDLGGHEVAVITGRQRPVDQEQVHVLQAEVIEGLVEGPAHVVRGMVGEIGRASCRERGEGWVGAAELKEKQEE